MLFRTAQMDDLDSIYQLANQTGVGLTTLPRDRDFLEKRIQHARRAFHQATSHHTENYYLFVLEDPQTHEVVGVSAIESAVGLSTPFYSYKISNHSNQCAALKIHTQYRMLHLVQDYSGASELCTLFLRPDYRRDHLGMFLSRARFLYMALFPNKFSETIIAELRGMSNTRGISPFWSALGKHFFGMSFQQADQMTLLSNKQFITDLMPKMPIYVELLPKSVQKMLGTPLPSSVPAFNILSSEGFVFKNHIDIFDAGPTIEAMFQQIRTIQNCSQRTIKKICPELAGTRQMISNIKTDFIAVLGTIVCDPNGNDCSIDQNSAKLLGVSLGDRILTSNGVLI